LIEVCLEITHDNHSALLILAELVVHARLRPTLQLLRERKVVPEAALPRLEAAVSSASKLRNSVSMEVGFALASPSTGHPNATCVSSRGSGCAVARLPTSSCSPMRLTLATLATLAPVVPLLLTLMPLEELLMKLVGLLF
jgi:hypothetical protein